MIAADQAVIPFNDLGLLRGYGIFDFFPIKDGLPQFYKHYFDRFYSSAEQMSLKVPVSRKTLLDRVVALVEANEMPDSFIKLVLTGGFAEDGYTPTTSNLFIIQHPMIGMNATAYAQGIKLLLQKYLKDLPHVKSLNYANALRQRSDIQAAGALDILYHDGRQVLETSRANFFVVDEHQDILTAKDGVLQGITRGQIIKLAREQGYSVHECPLTLDMITSASECFITSTTKGALPVVDVGGYLIGTGNPGPVSQLLQEKFKAL